MVNLAPWWELSELHQRLRFFPTFPDLEHWTSNNSGRDLLLEEAVIPDISGEELAYSVFKEINM